MPGPRAVAITLSKSIRAELEALAKRHKTEQQIAKRARVILAAADGQDNGAISRAVGLARKTVISWRQRWATLEAVPFTQISVEERLEDLPRPGGPLRISAEQRCQLEALACEAPEKAGRPLSQWSNRELADEVVKRNIVESISPRHAARLLKRGLHSAPQESLLAQ